MPWHPLDSPILYYTLKIRHYSFPDFQLMLFFYFKGYNHVDHLTFVFLQSKLSNNGLQLKPTVQFFKNLNMSLVLSKVANIQYLVSSN